MNTLTLGQIVHSFFVDHLPVTKGLRPSSIATYRDGMRLFLRFVAQDVGRTVVTLPLSDLTANRVLAFLRTLEADRHNHVRTRNHRLTMLRTFFAYLGDRMPECLATAEQVARMPTKRVPPPETTYMDRSDVEALFARLPSGTWAAERDRTLLLFLYNTGARVQEAADLRVGHMAHVSHLARHGHASPTAPGQPPERHAGGCGLPLPARLRVDTIRHLQDRPPTRGVPGQGLHDARPACHAARGATQYGRPHA